MQKQKLLIFFACLLTILQNSFAASIAADELAQFFTNMHTMQATFTQSLLNQQNSAIGTKTIGNMIIERPGKFRWEMTQPHQQLIIINKDKMLLYDPDLAQLTKRQVDYRRPGNPAMLLSSSVDSLKQSFQIVKLPKQGPGLWFKLTPKTQKNQESGYQWIKIHFVNAQLKAMYIHDNLEQTSLISFTNILLNLEIAPKKFTFTPPPNTDILNSR
jgi:outer membrane lipoprotein carrier protein